ncbi:hydroxypyruvate isomerase family protein [Flagellimonas myxillae]|uniref:hydroxypyruvate isomerase family protein n=1 Tax=Flagellimonas myxillae TaxID=2942214 RepID=UPI00201EBE86|nr:TIM barrel protein [Muricauda myxillae]MCL6267747.1 TIM barrel protein [Muricauda myxillae]
MKRRKFVGSVAATSALGFVPGILSAQQGSEPAYKGFNLKYAPHLGMFKNLAGDDPIDQLNFMADQGFMAFEDNGMKGRSLDLQEKMASTMAKRGISMGVFVAHKIYWKEPNLASGDENLREEFLSQIKESVEVAKRVNAKWMTVVPGHVDLRQNIGYQTAHVVESLKRASEILEPHGLVMVLEPLNFRNHPGLFLSESPQAYEVCKAVDSPSCKILFDIYHQQIQEGNLIPNIDACWEEIAYYQIGDNPGRNEPTSGEVNYKNVFKFIHSKGFKGILGMEHGNSIKGKEGEQRVIDAYKESDSFI